jgi:hypothetical protein
LSTLTFDALGKLTCPVAAAPLALGQVTSAVFNPPGAAAQSLTFDFSSSSQYGGSFGVKLDAGRLHLGAIKRL